MKKTIEFIKSNIKVLFLMTIAVVLLVYMFRYDFSRRIDYQVTDMVTEHLSDISHQSVASLGKELDRLGREVRYTAEFLSQQPHVTKEEEQLLYRQLKEKCRFSDIILVSTDGNVYTTDYELLPKSNGTYVEAICRGESGMTDVFSSSSTGENVFGFYAPVFRDETVVGGIAGMIIVDQMIDIIANTGFDSESYNYIMKPDGTVVSQTSHRNRLYTGREYMDFLRNNVRGGDRIAERLQTAMINGESGEFSYQAGHNSRIAYYEPTGHLNWYVVTAVSSEAAGTHISRINRTALHLMLKVVLLLAVLGLLFIKWNQKTKKMILESKEALELEKKKLELALRYTSNVIFEYNIKEDRMVFITEPVIAGFELPQVVDNLSKKIYGYPAIAPEYVEPIMNAIANVSQAGEQEHLEYMGGPAYDEEKWFRLTMSPVRDNKGEIVETMVTLEDITEEKKILRRFAQEEQYRAALLSEAVAMWSIDLAKKEVITYSLQGKSVLEDGATLPYGPSFYGGHLQNVHKEDRERVENMVQTGHLLNAYYTGERELKDLFRMRYGQETDYKWVTCVISLLTEPTTGNPLAFAYVRDVDEETKREMELSYSSERDPLTGLYNRRNIADKINHALMKENTLSCLMMLDLDGFKGVNDQYGHQMGDQVLKEIAQILTESFRSDDLVARLGGDEFLVFLTDVPERENAFDRAERVRKKIANMLYGDVCCNLSISIGLAFAPEDGDSYTGLYQRADEALYEAKRAGKNQIKTYQG